MATDFKTFKRKNLTKGLELLSNLTVWSKYAKYIPELKRRETWDEIVVRYLTMMEKKYPQLKDEIWQNGQFILEKKVLPSMRMLQFAGKAIEVNHSRGYNCFRRSTKFITSEGLRSFEDFNDGDIIEVPTHNKNWKTAVVRNYGQQEVVKHVFRKGKSEKVVYATKNHRWILKDSTETTDIKVGDGLYHVDWFNEFDYIDASVEEKLMWAYGYVYGDGTRTKDRNGDYKMSLVRLCKGDNKYLERFMELGFKYSSPKSFNSDVVVYTGSYLKELPIPNIESKESIRAFIRGYMDADGAKIHSGNNNSLFKSLQISKPQDEINQIIDLLSIAGFFITGSDDLTNQETNYGIRPNTQRLRGFTSFSNSPNTSWYLREKEEVGNIEDVWCLEVEDDASFILDGGLVTGNCAYLTIDDYRAFSETMFLLLGGTGVGYSVQNNHVEKLPEIRRSKGTRKFLVSDDIQGWADSIKAIMKWLYGYSSKPVFDYSDIRPKGARLVTAGGKAPGPEPLKLCHAHIFAILDRKEEGDKLTSDECHDILCHIANAVLAGGIRRSAMISLFNIDDENMLTCKFGNWWETNEQRGRSNNSAVIKRNKITKPKFDEIWEKIEASGSGEPGIYFTNNNDWGTNPCAEIALRSNQCCNLCEVNFSTVQNQEDFNNRVRVAAFFGTLQAGFTDFYYLREVWKRTCEKDALLGIGMTGLASSMINEIDFRTAVREHVIPENIRVAEIIGINRAARITCVKPSGTTSCVLGTSSGIHDWHSKYYLRTLRFGKDEAIVQYLLENNPEIIEPDVLRSHDTYCVRIPIAAPKGAITREETSAIDLLERVKLISNNWVKAGHINGENTHNVSATISIDKEKMYNIMQDYRNGTVDYVPDNDGNKDEWEVVREWMWENRDCYNGISVLPYFGGSYKQAPFEEISENEYFLRLQSLKEIDMSRIVEMEDVTDLKGEVACAGGQCNLD